MTATQPAALVRRLARYARPFLFALTLAVAFAAGLAYAPLPAVASTGAATASIEAPAGADAGYAAPDSDPFVRSELYFGTNRPDGAPVSDAEWENFLDNQITPRFPDGLTVMKGYGQFRNSSGVTIEERSIMLILLYPAETRAESNVKIEEIRDLYEETFEQESVLRVDDRLTARVSF